MTDTPDFGALSRRAFVAGLPLFLAACQTAGGSPTASGTASTKIATAAVTGPTPVVNGYGAITTEPFPIARSIRRTSTRASCARKFRTRPERSRARSWSIRLTSSSIWSRTTGRRGAMASASAARASPGGAGRSSTEKQEWPKWHPPTEMMARDPKARNGPRPAGRLRQSARRPRALPHQDGKDTLFRIHGTNAPNSIGKAMSSGCIRMLNQDVIDLYNRTPVGTEVVVVQSGIA